MWHCHGPAFLIMAMVKKKIAKKHKNRKLTDKEERFCYQYVLLLNGAKAAIAAGYAVKSARITASKLLTKANIQERVKRLKDNLADTAEISALRVLKEYEKMAFSSIAHLHDEWIELRQFEALTEDQKSIIKSISTKTLKKNIGTKDEPELIDVEYVKIELHDKPTALKGIREMCGFDAPKEVKAELTGNLFLELMQQATSK